MSRTNVTERNATLAATGQRVCASCGSVRPFAEFYAKAGRSGLSGLSTWCKSCTITRRKYVYANSGKVRAITKRSSLKAHFGISLEQWNEMFAAQKGCCAVCLRHASEFKKGLVVDHDHQTGVIRALLCTRCNVGIGMFDEDASLMTAAMAYLRLHSSNVDSTADAKKEG